jgi:pilus assembly protein CpaE
MAHMLSSHPIETTTYDETQYRPGPAAARLDTDSSSAALSVALISPEAQQLRALAQVLAATRMGSVQEFAAYPKSDEVEQRFRSEFDVIIVELDSNPARALECVELLCAHSTATVMVSTARADADILMGCMRSGAREVLTAPLSPVIVTEALRRAAARRPGPRTPRKAPAKLFVFTGAKGGSGTTTIASNFALAVARESAKNTLLIDLNLPLGDAALTLGITAEFFVPSALENAARLDTNFLSKLLTKHPSGLSLLASPDRCMDIHVEDDAIHKLLTVARQDFDFVVVDIGTDRGAICRLLFEAATTVYLVTQVAIAELRNANRLIAGLSPALMAKLEVILNRYQPRSIEIDEESITKALTVAAQWKLPNDYAAVRRAQNTATPLLQEASGLAKAILLMARAACNITAGAENKRRFKLFG